MLALMLMPVVCTVRSVAAQTATAVLPVAAALPATYQGNCPAKIEFIGRVTVTVPGTRIAYRWERSSGDSTKLREVQIGMPAKSPDDTGRVTATLPSDFWRAALPSQSGVFWEILHIESPVDVRSAPARVAIECTN